MLKSATVYGFTRISDFTGLDQKLAAQQFTPVGDLQVDSQGFEPVYEGALVFSSHGSLLLRFTVEQKRIPKSAIDVELQKRCDAFEKEYAHKPGKKARKEMRERVVDDLLPRALASRRSMLVWVDLEAKRLVFDTTSGDMIDRFFRSYFKCVEKADITTLDQWVSAATLGQWLLDPVDNLPETYTIDDAAKLEYGGEKGTVVTFKKADLDTPRVRDHLANGAAVTSLAMTFDDKISFVMTPNRQIRSIRALDVLKEHQVEQDLDAFTNDFVLMTGELRRLIDSIQAWA